MLHDLKCHPHSDWFPPIQVEVEVVCLSRHSLALSYTIKGDVSQISIPAAATPKRGDNLWRHTCFEAFVRGTGAEYYEFNFAPTAEWAAYRFSSYRAGKHLAEINPPRIKLHSQPDRYSLQATLQLDAFPRLADQPSWRLGLSAVIEDPNGRMSYWALAHTPGKPDFHHSDCFAYEVSLAAQS